MATISGVDQSVDFYDDEGKHYKTATDAATVETTATSSPPATPERRDASGGSESRGRSLEKGSGKSSRGRSLKKKISSSFRIGKGKSKGSF